MLETLSAALGVAGKVRNTRRLYKIGQTRIHLDQVECLGDFLEIEVVLNPSQTEEQGTETAFDVARRLGINGKDMFACAYADLAQRESL